MKYLVLAMVLTMSVGIILSVASQAYATNTNNGGNAAAGVAHSPKATANVLVNTAGNGAAGDIFAGGGGCPNC